MTREGGGGGGAELRGLAHAALRKADFEESEFLNSITQKLINFYTCLCLVHRVPPLSTHNTVAELNFEIRSKA